MDLSDIPYQSEDSYAGPPAAAAPVMAPMPAPLAPSAYQAPVDPSAARTGAGVGVVMAVGGTGLGFWLGGPMGAGAGLLLVGALRNTLRATRNWASPDPIQRQDAGTSASLAMLGALVGGYLSYRVYREKQSGE